MNIALQETNRWCHVNSEERPSPRKMRADILRDYDCQSAFTTLLTPLPPRDQTVFKIAGNDRELLIGIALFHCDINRLSPKVQEMTDGAEIFFDMHHDRLGFHQFIVNSKGAIETLTHLPYPDAHSTAYPLLQPKKCKVEDQEFTSATFKAWRCRWVWAWFDTSEIFRYQQTVGFNICRSRPSLNEFSGWNRLSGYGAQDATTFGHLHRHEPAIQLQNVTAKIEAGVLRLAGESRSNIRSIDWELTNPLGESISFQSPVKRGHWSGEVVLQSTPAGRYRLRAVHKEKAIEPAEYSLDIAAPQRDFTVSMTYDTPMSVIPNYYTPERLRDEMRLVGSLGINRLHWIEYGNGDDWPSFWAHERWAKNARKTFQHCGNFLKCAVEQAHANNLQLYAICKVFDIGMNVWFSDKASSSFVRDIEGRYVTALPAIVSQQELTLQSNTNWRRDAAFPITRLRVYSETPIPDIDPASIHLRTSKNNRDYKRYNGTIKVRQGVLRRPHYRWTPSGKVREPGAAKNWFVELDGLQINESFAAIEISGQEIPLVHRGFMLVEAEDAAGNLAPLTVATKGHRDFEDAGYYFWKEWPGWANYTEPILQRRRWTGHDLGLTFQQMPNMPTLLEPSFEGARSIWLAWLQRALDCGVDGINIRTLCNHNGAMAWLQYAFATPVLETFESLYGHLPDCSPQDYERVRRIRGDFFTQFLRDAKSLCAAYGAKLVTHLEAGLEVPVQLDTRMQLHLDYRTWISQGIVDEVDLKGWTAHNPWVHEEVLPLARRHDVPVHIISPCLDNGFGLTAIQAVPQLLTDAYRAGFSGYNFYETDNLIELSPEGTALSKGYTAPALLRARAELDALRNGETQ